MVHRKKQSWPFIKKRTYPSGRTVWQVDARTKNGGERRALATSLEAETFATLQRAKRENEGNSAFSLTSSDRMDAETALELLRPHGRSLTDAARFLVQNLATVRASATVVAVVSELLTAKTADGASPRYLKDLRSRLTTFAKSFGQRLVSEVSTSELDDWLRGLGQAAVTRNNYRRLLGVMFSFARQRRYCLSNPVQETAKAKVIKDRPGVLTVEQAANLLEAADDEILPAIALGLFAGLRPESEIWRLDWSKIDFESKQIDVAPDATKNARDSSEGASHRYVIMLPPLLAWLKPFRGRLGLVAPTGDKYFNRLERARAKANILEWPHDALRHTYGSMHYAQFKDVGATMAEMGHTNPKTFFRHYRARVQPNEAAKFWSLMPPCEQPV